MIYFMAPVGGGPINIGFAADVEARRVALEAIYGRPFVVLATMNGGRREEAMMHARFSHLRLGHSSQFRPAPDLMVFIGCPFLASANPDDILAMETAPEWREQFKTAADAFMNDHDFGKCRVYLCPCGATCVHSLRGDRPCGYCHGSLADIPYTIEDRHRLYEQFPIQRNNRPAPPEI